MYCRAYKTATLTPIQHTVCVLRGQKLAKFADVLNGWFLKSLLSPSWDNNVNWKIPNSLNKRVN